MGFGPNGMGIMHELLFVDISLNVLPLDVVSPN